MARFCTSCGAEIGENASFCTSCGAAQTPSSDAPASVPQQDGAIQQGMDMSNVAQAAGAAAKNAAEKVKNTFDGVNFDSVKNSMSAEGIKNVGKTKDKNVIIGLSAVALLVVIVLCIVFSMVGKPYTKPVDSMFKAMSKGDGQALVDALPEYYTDFYEDNYMGDKYDTLAEFFEDEMLENLVDGLEDDYGKNVKITYKVVKKKEIKKKDLNDLEESVEDRYDEKVKVEKGYELKLKATVKGSEDKDTDTARINVYKIDGKWVIAGLESLSTISD